MTGIGVTHIDHVSVLITDLAKARAFYNDLLGLKEIPKPRTFDFVALWYDLGGGHTLHLLQKPLPDVPSPRHFCLRVKDVQQARAYCIEKGISVAETTTIPGADRFFVHDPDGNRIEILQWLTPYDPSITGASQLD